jgi:hypothetical protein
MTGWFFHAERCSMKEFDLDPETERAFLEHAQKASYELVMGDHKHARKRRGGITTEELLRRANAAADKHASADDSRK